ncbi:hypothetical protein FRB93_005587 [Tulasnella sp. JGI-2019a]|nr:hypothetical protein FRB93_005587 [Tulasnella sp. JGI-2019a]
MPSMKTALKTVQVKISKLPKFAKASWLKLRGHSPPVAQRDDFKPASKVQRSELTTVGAPRAHRMVGTLQPLSVAPASLPAHAGSGGSGQVTEYPSSTTGSSIAALSTSILPSTAPTAFHSPIPHPSSHSDPKVQAAPHSLRCSPTPTDRVSPKICEQITGSLGSPSDMGCGSNESSPFDVPSVDGTPYQTSMEPSPCLSLAGTNTLGDSSLVQEGQRRDPNARRFDPGEVQGHKEADGGDPAQAAAILPLEHKALPKAPEAPWKKVRALGKGTFGSVILQRRRIECSDGTQYDQLTAVKHSKWTQAETSTERTLLRLMPRLEYALLKKLAKASHVVHAQEMYEDPIRGTCSIIMEYVPGVSLANWMAWNEGSTWPASTCVALGFQLFSGVVQIRKLGITHADIKPENIMIKDDGHLVLCDFGLAYIGDAALVPGGTHLYTPPEVEQGIHSARDVYAAGTTLAEEARLCEKIAACHDVDDWKARPSAARMQLFMRCLKMTEHSSPPMDEQQSRRFIAQQLKDDPPRKPSRAQTVRWTVEHRVRTIAALAVDYCRLP